MEVSKERMIELVKNAPEGATHYVPQLDIFREAYINKDSGLMWLIYGGLEGEWLKNEYHNSEDFIKLDYSVLEDKPVYAKEMQDRYEIERFVKSCQHAEGDIEKTGVMWSLTEVESHIDEYFKPEKTDQEKLIDELVDCIESFTSVDDPVKCIAKSIAEHFNITRKGESNE